MPEDLKTCRFCHQTLQLGRFTKDGHVRHQCRDCARDRLRDIRGATVARRLHFNLMQRLRNHDLPERAHWTLERVEELIMGMTIDEPGDVRLVRINPAKPWMPFNVKAVFRKKRHTHDDGG